MAGTIVCGVTDTAEGCAAAQLAAAVAARLGLRLVLVHVVPGAGPDGRSPPAPDGVAGFQQELEQIVRELGGDVEARFVRGSRGDELARVAADEGADMIVVGSRPRGARRRQLRCALACELEAATTVPVLIAPPATRRRSGRRLALAESPAPR